MTLRAMVLILAIVVPDASRACMAHIHMDLRDVLTADVVFVGKLTARRVVQQNHGAFSSYYVETLTFRIDDVLAGDVSDNPINVAIWYDNRPPDLSLDRSYVVALKRPTDAASKMRDQKPPHIMQVHCDGMRPFAFDKEGEVGRAVRDIFDGIGDATAEAEAYAKSLGFWGQQHNF